VTTITLICTNTKAVLEMWANAQRDGRPAICSVPAHEDGQTSCKVWLASGERRRCSNEANA